MDYADYRGSDAGVDINVVQANGLEQFGSLSVQTGSTMLEQWNPWEYARPVCACFSHTLFGYWATSSRACNGMG